MKKLRGEYVLIEPETEETTASGIRLTKQPEQGDLVTGVIRYVGNGFRVKEKGIEVVFDSIDLEVGDKVLFQYGQKVKIDDKFLLLVNESDVKIVL